MRHDYPDPTEMEVMGFRVIVDDTLGHLAVAHDGSISWDQLQRIKNLVWGLDARAIEAYPPQSEVINNVQMRHLWLLGADDFLPDLLGRSRKKQTLERRFEKAWEGS